MPMTTPPLATRLAAFIGHLYPFLSGCGTVANARLMRRFDPSPPADLMVGVTGGRALVPSNDYVARAMLYIGDLDRKISRLIDASVRPGDVALDIGANLGLVSLRLADRVGPQGVVHAFEPSPRLAPYLAATLAANPALNITLHPVALGRERAVLPLAIPAGNAGAATLLRGAPDAAQRGGGETIDVPIHVLADYAAEIGLGRVDFVKIDVEGFEADVIAGAAPLFGRLQPKVIVLEEHAPARPGDLPPALALLAGLGYDLYALSKSLFRLTLLPLDHRDAVVAHDYVAVSKSETGPIRQRLGIGPA